MIVSLCCASCHTTAANVAFRNPESRPAAVFRARLVAVAKDWAVDVGPVDPKEPALGVCPWCRVRSTEGETIYRSESR